MTSRYEELAKEEVVLPRSGCQREEISLAREERPTAARNSGTDHPSAAETTDAAAAERLQLQKENSGLRRLIVELLETNQRLREQIPHRGSLQ